MRTGMARDFSWDRSGEKYTEVYREFWRIPGPGLTRMDVVLVLHSHIPYVLHHGRWPHGSDWLCEAAIDSYLPLLDALRHLAEEDVPAPITIGFTPVLANQLADPAFAAELRGYFAQREAACADATRELRSPDDRVLLPIVAFWQRRLTQLRELFEQIEGDLPTAFAALERAGRMRSSDPPRPTASSPSSAVPRACNCN